jgi:hypothetical protein
VFGKEGVMRNSLLLLAAAVSAGCAGLIVSVSAAPQAGRPVRAYTESFALEQCDFQSVGRNEYFILEPGYQLVLEGTDGKDVVTLKVTVLNETRKIGAVETRVVEERETARGNVTEVSRNFYAFCAQTNSVFYFGEEVDDYKGGKIVGHGGTWIADGKNSMAGLMIPGIVLLGARYYQEKAPGMAMDRAEILSTTETLTTPAGTFRNCLKTEETTALNPGEKDYKYYAPGIGLIRDGDLVLTHYGVAGK